jgi:hypothetical protein
MTTPAACNQEATPTDFQTQRPHWVRPDVVFDTILQEYQRPSEREMMLMITDFYNFQKHRKRAGLTNHFGGDVVSYLGPLAVRYDAQAREVLVKLYKDEPYWLPSDKNKRRSD